MSFMPWSSRASVCACALSVCVCVCRHVIKPRNCVFTLNILWLNHRRLHLLWLNRARHIGLNSCDSPELHVKDFSCEENKCFEVRRRRTYRCAEYLRIPRTWHQEGNEKSWYWETLVTQWVSEWGKVVEVSGPVCPSKIYNFLIGRPLIWLLEV